MAWSCEEDNQCYDWPIKFGVNGEVHERRFESLSDFRSTNLRLLEWGLRGNNIGGNALAILPSYVVWGIRTQGQRENFLASCKERIQPQNSNGVQYNLSWGGTQRLKLLNFIAKLDVSSDNIKVSTNSGFLEACSNRAELYLRGWNRKEVYKAFVFYEAGRARSTKFAVHVFFDTCQRCSLTREYPCHRIFASIYSGAPNSLFDGFKHFISHYPPTFTISAVLHNVDTPGLKLMLSALKLTSLDFSEDGNLRKCRNTASTPGFDIFEGDYRNVEKDNWDKNEEEKIALGIWAPDSEFDFLYSKTLSEDPPNELYSKKLVSDPSDESGSDTSTLIAKNIKRPKTLKGKNYGKTFPSMENNGSTIRRCRPQALSRSEELRLIEEIESQDRKILQGSLNPSQHEPEPPEPIVQQQLQQQQYEALPAHDGSHDVNDGQTLVQDDGRVSRQSVAQHMDPVDALNVDVSKTKHEEQPNPRGEAFPKFKKPTVQYDSTADESNNSQLPDAELVPAPKDIGATVAKPEDRRATINPPLSRPISAETLSKLLGDVLRKRDKKFATLSRKAGQGFDMTVTKDTGVLNPFEGDGNWKPTKPTIEPQRSDHAPEIILASPRFVPHGSRRRPRRSQSTECIIDGWRSVKKHIKKAKSSCDIFKNSSENAVMGAGSGGNNGTVDETAVLRP